MEHVWDASVLMNPIKGRFSDRRKAHIVTAVAIFFGFWSVPTLFSSQQKRSSAIILLYHDCVIPDTVFYRKLFAWSANFPLSSFVFTNLTLSGSNISKSGILRLDAGC